MKTYRIDIFEIESTEQEEREYKLIGEDAEGKDKWGYVSTGNQKLVESENLVYSQKKEDLDVPELAVYINRAR